MLEAMPERYSNTQSYTSYLNGYIKPKWGDYDVVTLGQNPFWVEKWLRALPNAPKTKAHIKGLMHRLYEYAMKWRMMSIQRNPMELVEVLSGHVKTGQWWPRQNRPTEMTRD